MGLIYALGQTGTGHMRRQLEIEHNNTSETKIEARRDLFNEDRTMVDPLNEA
jgi:hypothetical protein